jgi:hypothetical protein
MPSVELQHPRDNEPVPAGVPLTVAGVARGSGGLEQRVIESVTVAVDGGLLGPAKTKGVPKQPVPTVTFTSAVTLTEPGPHSIAVTATDDGGDTASAAAVVQVPLPVVTYPAWHATARQVFEELFAVSRHQSSGASIYLGTLESQSDQLGEGGDHHQGIARTHLLSDGSVYFFLAHSEMGFEEHGNLMQFRYPGPFDGEHVQTTDPLVVTPGPTAGDHQPAPLRHGLPPGDQRR